MINEKIVDVILNGVVLFSGSQRDTLKLEILRLLNNKDQEIQHLRNIIHDMQYESPAYQLGRQDALNTVFSIVDQGTVDNIVDYLAKEEEIKS